MLMSFSRSLKWGFFLFLAFAGTLCARERLSLDGTWSFATDPEARGEADGWFVPGAKLAEMPLEGYAPEADGTIQVPGIWDNQGYGTRTDKLEHNFIGLGWYKRTFRVPAEWSGKRVFLTLGGISRLAKVWINGELTGPDFLGQVASFTRDVTPFVRFGEENDITICVDSFQHWEKDAVLGSSSINDYMEIAWGGLWGHVTLEAVGAERLDSLYVTTTVADQTVLHAKADILNQSAADTVHLELFDADGALAASSRASVGAGAGDVAFDLPVPGAKLWTPDTPNLYTAKMTLLKGDVPLDEIQCRCGLRQFTIEGDRLFLNGRPIFLRGYGDDHIYPYEFSMPTNIEMYRARLRIIKSFGFNHVRHHSTILPHEYYDACDEIGVIPTAEFAICYPQQLPGNSRWKANVPEGTDTEPAMETYRERFTQAVKEYRNHPCILVWVGGNELWMGNEDYPGQELYTKFFKETVEKYDPARFYSDTDGDWLNYFKQGRDRDSLDIAFALFDEWVSPIATDKFAWSTFKKPTLSHEAGNYITFSRPNQIELFADGRFDGNPSLAGRDPKAPIKSDFIPFWMTDGARKLKELGLDDQAEAWARASEEMYYIHHKYNVEGMRLNPGIIGYHWWLIQDFWTTSNGLMDLFFRPKSITPQRVRLFNAPLVLLQKDLKRTYRGADPCQARFFVSNFTDAPICGVLHCDLELASGTTRQSCGVNNILPGTVAEVMDISSVLPEVDQPSELTIRLELQDDAGETIQSNLWHAMLYPKSVPLSQIDGRAVYADEDVLNIFPEAGMSPIPLEGELSSDALYVTSYLDERLTKALDAGAGVVLLGSGGIFPTESIQYQQTWWKGGDSDHTNHVGTFVYKTPFTEHLETADWCQPHWYTLLDKAVKFYLEKLPVRPNVQIRALPSLVRVQDTAVVFDAAVGKGTLVVSGLNHSKAKDQPESDSTLAALLKQAAAGPSGPAVMKAGDLATTDAVPEGTVLGFRRLMEGKYEQTTWKTWRGDNDPNIVCRQNSKENVLSWRTAPAPADGEVTYIFAGGLGFTSSPASEGFVFEANGKKLFTFDVVPEEGDRFAWEGEGARMEFEVLRRSPSDAFGRFRLTLPESLRSKAGTVLTVRSLGEGSSRWFAIYPFNNLLVEGE